ncbi:signal transduction histidine kinase/CHASE1-domain containing sensor protein/DNA-binding response OmpR family regulator [Oceanisphaera litoralis]|uniref:CHASE domain-containing protein n=1 Tax=Oceanisphaera litoralis TaxID=225144 RepID=UPI001958F4CC|nr:CHASE domain-containing protein [Oceanisphaera litoralis]MBM7455086.1 signal transduction histidine kinase/CHASE1-domain containing sensor protein/DNA-binding response OmpR family regulator [Oceanisphaera litoralis]
MKLHLGFIRNRWSLLALVIGLAVSTLLAWQLHLNNEQRVQKAVAETATETRLAIQNRLKRYEYGLHGARGAVLAAGKHGISRVQFHRYSLTRNIDKEFPGARGFGFIRRVPRFMTETFVELARADGWPDFRIKELAVHEGERYVIQYIEPVKRNIESVGLDIGSEKTRRDAAEAAIRTGEIRLTGPITLVQASGKPLQSFLILMPVYRGGVTPATEAKREQEALGLSYAPLLMEEVLSTLRLDADTVHLELFDVTEPGEKHRFYSHAPETDAALGAHPKTLQFEVNGRRWESRLSVHPAFVEQMNLDSPLAIFLVGGLFSLLLAAFIGVISNNRQRERQHQRELEDRIDQRTGELASVRDQLLMAAGVAELGIWTWTLADCSLDWNDKMFELYGYPVSLRDQGLGYKHWSARLHPDDAEDAVSCMEEIALGTGTYDPVFRLLLPDGHIRYIQAGARVERDAGGQVIRVTGINVDITKQRELETELRQAKVEADDASAAKSTFLNNMSHEIRTPLNAVLGMLQLVQQTALEPRQSDYIGKAHRAARSLLGLLNDILDYAKIEAGKLQLEPHPFELEDLMQELAVVLSGNLGSKPVELMFDFSPSLPGSLVGDRLRLQQVLINLAGNGVKFTEQGEVVIRIGELSRGQGKIRLRIEVIDTGIGIAEDKLESILEGFNQAEASTARRFGGTGLGLVISKRLLGLMGAELGVRSTPGEGSCFWFDLTLELDEASPPLVPVEEGEQPLRVLVVDDHRVSADILARVARQQGWQVNIANSGQQALREVEQNPGYDMVLMDWSMPDMNGLEAAAKIRTLAQEQLPTVIMVTAYGREQLAQAQQGSCPAFVDFLTKPVTPQQLITSVKRALAGETVAPQHKTIAAPSRQRLIGLRLLVVEDNALNREVAAELLRGEGASVELAEGGLEGVGKVVAAPTAFDMVLMDMQMPDIDGLEATRRIRAHDACRDLPILAMTANVTTADQLACLAAGMNAHMAKPVEIEQLVAVLLSFSANKGGQRVKPPERHTGTAEPIDAIVRRFGGDARLYRRLLTGFEQEAAALFDELEHHVRKQNRVATAATLHTFRGAAGTMGAATFASRLSGLEQQIGEQSGESVFALLDNAGFDVLKAGLAQERAALLDAVPLPEVTTEPVVNREATPDPGEATGERIKAQLEPLLMLLEAGNMDAIDCFEQLPGAVLASLSERRDTLATEIQNLDFTVASNTVRDLLETL